MTGKTHQLVALAAVTAWGAMTDPPVLGIQGVMIVLGATMLGALTPDIDHPTSGLWKIFPAGSLIGRIARALLGGHRNVTHSLLAVYLILRATSAIVKVVHPDFTLIAETAWKAYSVGFLSHLIADTFTDRGVPWLWPLSWNIGIPPGPNAFRITTGSSVERHLLLPGLFVVIIVLWIRFWPMFRTIILGET